MILFTFIFGTLWLVWWVYTAFAYRPRRLAGATVVVTGACSEVGRRLCIQLYAQGARVIAWDYSRIKLQELQAEVQRTAADATTTAAKGATAAADGAAGDDGSGVNENFRIAAVDASSRVQVQRAAKEITGAVDMIINAAHSFPTRALHDRADDSVDRVFQTNLVSPLLVVRQLLPMLFTTATTTAAAAGPLHRRDDYAQVVNIVSAAGSATVAAEAPDYAASQWGMVGMHYSLRAWIAQERAAYQQGAQENEAAPPQRGTLKAETSKAGVRRGRHAREVRTTLVCLDAIQSGVPTSLTSLLAPPSAMRSGSPRTTASSAAGSVTRATRATSPSPSSPTTSGEGYTSAVQRRSAELDRAVADCLGAIRRGQERYCHGAAWRTTALFPIAMLCPLPLGERLLQWGQRTPASPGSLDS